MFTRKCLFCKQIFFRESSHRHKKKRICHRAELLQTSEDDTWWSEHTPPPLRLRSVFISDVHLGFKGCSAELLLDFLHHVEMDTLFLVGDIIDVWSMKKTMYWPQAHNNVVRTILGKAKRGTKVIFVPGNHDEVFREFDGAVFGNLEIHREYMHVARRRPAHARPARGRVRQRGEVQPLAREAGKQHLRLLLAANPYINWVRR